MINAHSDHYLVHKGNTIQEGRKVGRYVPSKIMNEIFNLSLPKPKNIEDKVTLLIFGFDNDQKSGRLKRLITKNKQYAGIKIYSIGNIKKVVPGNLWKAKAL
jgi:hypothetical protein